MPTIPKTQERAKKSGDANNRIGEKTDVSKGSKVGKASDSTDKIPRSSNGKWDDGVKTMRRVQKKDDADDRKANGVQGVLANAAKNVVDPKKQGGKHGLLR
ncbi:uncharacterized protein EAE98_003075 [Botrytis deweyae]|uniref:CsbD-like domain-containing protein n=1 Tax=Botrytis deweyae TaxID=2478750 RepID=A0ABQ7IVI6_9HELO|nr:uncharacterized protein EAE98_003075 [Botrytis deweyae]KAF7935030.1 hypothetical protein EAE98_003075 [Botrytis deweyae]